MDKTYILTKNKEGKIVFDPTTKDVFHYNLIVGTYSRYQKIFNPTTKNVEEILLIQREYTPENLKRASDAKIANIKKSPAEYDFYQMEYEKDEIEKVLSSHYWNDLFDQDEIINIFTESGKLSIKISDTLRLYTKQRIPYKVKISMEKDQLKVTQTAFVYSFFKEKMQIEYASTTLMMNLETGLSYLYDWHAFNTKVALQNATLDKYLYDQFCRDLTDDMLNDMYIALKDYYVAQGVTVDDTKFESLPQTIIAFNHNPTCINMYKLKHFFSGSFRKNFKRLDTNHYEDLCEKLDLDKDDMRDVFDKEPETVFKIKLLKEMGFSEKVATELATTINNDQHEFIDLKYLGPTTNYIDTAKHDFIKYLASLVKSLLAFYTEEEVKTILFEMAEHDFCEIRPFLKDANVLSRYLVFDEDFADILYTDGLTEATRDVFRFEADKEKREEHEILGYKEDVYDIEETYDDYSFTLIEMESDYKRIWNDLKPWDKSSFAEIPEDSIVVHLTQDKDTCALIFIKDKKMYNIVCQGRFRDYDIITKWCDEKSISYHKVRSKLCSKHSFDW